MFTKKSVLVFLCVIAGTSLLINLHKQEPIYAWTHLNSDALARLELAATSIPKKIVIGAVSCRNKLVPSIDYNNYTITMLKSVIMSAQRDHVPAVDIHLFVEHPDTDADYIKRNVLVKHKFKNSVPIVVNVYTYSAVDIIPEKFRGKMIYNEKRYRCAYVRMFYPLALPSVDSIIHMDSDIIVTGSISKLWQQLGRMNEKQIISASRIRAVNNNWYPSRDKNYEKIPHVLPKALASGLLLMNLTRLRKFGWQTKILQNYNDYSKIDKMNDQKALNILIVQNPGIYQIIPCNFHFMMFDCEMEWFCNEADEDAQGVHLIHGYSHLFHTGNFWNELYTMFERFNVSSVAADFLEDIVNPVRDYYARPDSKNLCYGTINRTLFKEYFAK